MPSLHCHLPPEEVEKMPEQDEVIDLGEIVAPRETNEQPMDDTPAIVVETSDDEIYDVDDEDDEDEEESNDSSDNAIDDTSSEASSMLNDPTIQRWVPVVSSSSDDDECERFWTPPSSMEDDYMDVCPPSNQGADRRNTARRSRGRRPGVCYMRRGRHRQPLNQQEWYRLTPFERGITFNGFARNLEPETITYHMSEYPDELLYAVKWRDMSEPKLIEASVMRAYRPQLVIDYWEAFAVRRSY